MSGGLNLDAEREANGFKMDSEGRINKGGDQFYLSGCKRDVQFSGFLPEQLGC